MAEEAMENRRTTFPIGIQGPGATKLRAVVQSKLVELGVHTDDVLAEYVVVLVGHGKQYAQTAEDLEAFLADDTTAFMDWLWEHLSTHKHLYLSTEEEHGGEGDFTVKEGEDAERESPSSPDDSDSAEEQLPLEDHQNKSQDGIGQKVEKLVPRIEKGGGPGLANVDEELDGPMHEERQGRGRRDDMAAEKIEEQYIHHERDGHRFGKDSDGIDRRGGRERQSRMSGRDTDEHRSRGERSDIVTDSLTRNRTDVRTDDLRRSGGQREEREEGWGGERRRYESPFADSRSRGRPHDGGPRGPQGNEEMEWRSRGRFRSDERRGDKQTTSGGRNFLDRVEGDVSWRNRGRNEENGRPERQHRVSRRDTDPMRMDVEEELKLPGPPPLRPPLLDRQVDGGEGQVEAVERIRVELNTDKMGVKRRRQREDGERVEAAAPNSVDEEPVGARPPRLAPTARLLQSAVREAVGPPSAPPPPPLPALKRLRPSTATATATATPVAEDTEMREAIGRVVAAAEGREANGTAQPQQQLQPQTQTRTRSVFGRLGVSVRGEAPSTESRLGGRMWPQGGGMTSITAAHYGERDVPVDVRVERWGLGTVNGGQMLVREEEGSGEEPRAARAMTIGERIKVRLAALAGGDGDRVRHGQGAGQRQGGVGVGAGMGGGKGAAFAAAKPFAASEEALVVCEESVEEMKKRMWHVQLEVMKLKAQKPATAVAGAVAAAAPTLPPPDEPAVFVTNVHFAATSAGLGAHFGGCGEAGQVILVKVPGTGAPSGSAYVTFLSEEAAQAAVGLNGSSFAARSLKVVRHHPGSLLDAPLSSKLRTAPTQGGASYARGGGGYSRPSSSQKKLQWTRSNSLAAPRPTSASPILPAGESVAEGAAGVSAPEPLVKDASLPKSMSWTRPGGNAAKPLVATQRRSLSYMRPLGGASGEGAEGVGSEGMEAGLEV